MSEVDGEVLFQCPYDNTHMVRLKRMPYHLMLCRKNFPNSNLVACPFNALHEIPKAELQYHVSTCCDKHRIEQEAAGKAHCDNSQYKGYTDVPAYTNYQQNIPHTENWDAEVSRDPKVFVFGQSYKYDPSIIGPEDYRAEGDSETVTILGQQYAKNMLVDDSGTNWTRLPSETPKVLGKHSK